LQPKSEIAFDILGEENKKNDQIKGGKHDRTDMAYILAVDDSTFNLEALQLILKIHFRCESDTAVSGKKSLLLVEERLKK